MRIRLATREDLPALMGLMRRVVPLMRAAGNLQWDETYPNETVFQRDIDLGQLWVADAETSIGGLPRSLWTRSPTMRRWAGTSANPPWWYIGSRSTLHFVDLE